MISLNIVYLGGPNWICVDLAALVFHARPQERNQCCCTRLAGALKMGLMRGGGQAAMPQLAGYTFKCPQIHSAFADDNKIHFWEKEPTEIIRNINVITEVY